MKRLPALFCVIMICTLVFVLAVAIPGLADAGEFSGSSDYGGSSDWGGGSDWGGNSDWDGSYYIVDGSSIVDRSSDSDSDFGIFDGLTLLAIALVVFAVWFYLKKSKRKIKGSTGSHISSTPPVPLSTMAEFQAIDPNFSEAALVEKISNLYVQMQNAWQQKQWEPMRACMTDTLYQQFARQLQPYQDQAQTNHIEHIAVLGVALCGYTQDDTNSIITARLRTRIIDYVTDDKTQKLIRGNMQQEKFMEYEWTLIRSKSMLSRDPSAEGIQHVNCPNCGAPVEINQSARCEFCGTILSSSDYDWVISSIKGISQRTGH